LWAAAGGEAQTVITVAICTLNRGESQRRTLGSLAAMQLPDDLDWEFEVVNNGCSDHTDDVIKAFADRLPVRRELRAAARPVPRPQSRGRCRQGEIYRLNR
jgi:glycosyltransferase involved in cell wall biosynthesis